MNTKNMAASILVSSFLLAPSAHAGYEWTHQTSGAALSVTTAATNGTFVVGTDNNVYEFTNTGSFPWAMQTSSGNLALVAESQNGDLWALTTSGHPCQVSGGQCVANAGITAGVGTGIGVSNGNVPYIIDTNGALRAWNGSTWENLGGNIHELSVWDYPFAGSFVPVPVAIGTDNLLWDYFSGWNHIAPPPGTPTVAGDHIVLSSGTIYVFSESNGSWSEIGVPPVSASTVVQISVAHTHAPPSGGADSFGDIWLVDNSHNIWQDHQVGI